MEAARKVFVTQSTVSMRIKVLEDQLGKTLFDRGKSGATLTPAGAQFHKHAVSIIRVWEQARLEIALPEGFQSSLTIGGQYSLWDGFLLDCLAGMRAAMPKVAIRAQTAVSSVLMNRLLEGSLDIGVMYTPEVRPGFKIELIFEEHLVLVSNHTKAAHSQEYVYVDWGPEFRADHSINFPDLATPPIYMELGSLGLQYLLEHGGSGYFPRRQVAAYLEAGALQEMENEPVFTYPAYAVYPEGTNDSGLACAMSTMRKLAGRFTRTGSLTHS